MDFIKRSLEGVGREDNADEVELRKKCLQMAERASRYVKAKKEEARRMHVPLDSTNSKELLRSLASDGIHLYPLARPRAQAILKRLSVHGMMKNNTVITNQS